MGIDIENPQDQRVEEPQNAPKQVDIGNTLVNTSMQSNNLSKPLAPVTNPSIERD